MSFINSGTPERESRPIASAITVNWRRDSRRNNENIYQKSVLRDKMCRIPQFSMTLNIH